MNNIVKSERLVIKPIVDGDLVPFVASQQDEIFKLYTGGVQTIEAATDKFVKEVEYFQKHGYGFFSAFLADNGEWMGQIGVTTRATKEFVEFGWGFLPKFQGKGFAIEAAKAVLEWCNNRFGFADFYFCISPRNLSSVKLAEKLGAKNIGTNKVPEELKETDVEIWYLKYDNN